MDEPQSPETPSLKNGDHGAIFSEAQKDEQNRVLFSTDEPQTGQFAAAPFPDSDDQSQKENVGLTQPEIQTVFQNDTSKTQMHLVNANGIPAGAYWAYYHAWRNEQVPALKTVRLLALSLLNNKLGGALFDLKIAAGNVGVEVRESLQTTQFIGYHTCFLFVDEVIIGSGGPKAFHVHAVLEAYQRAIENILKPQLNLECEPYCNKVFITGYYNSNITEGTVFFPWRYIGLPIIQTYPLMTVFPRTALLPLHYAPLSQSNLINITAGTASLSLSSVPSARQQKPAKLANSAPSADQPKSVMSTSSRQKGGRKKADSKDLVLLENESSSSSEQILRDTAEFNKKHLRMLYSSEKCGETLMCRVFFDDRKVSHAYGKSKASAKALACDVAVEELKLSCWRIKVRQVEVSDVEVTRESLSSSPPMTYESLAADSIGGKMMQKMGWKGGRLGKHRDGLLEPIDHLQQVPLKRQGLGFGTLGDDFDKAKVNSLLEDFACNGKPHQNLVLSAEFTEEEREYFKIQCQNLYLGVKECKEVKNRLVVSSKWDKQAVMRYLSMVKDETRKYELVAPFKPWFQL